MENEKEYTYNKIQRLANKISKIKRKRTLVRIYEIIIETPGNDNVCSTQNNNGLFMYFHKLNEETYRAIENYLTLLDKKKSCDINPISSEDNVFEKYTPYSQDDFPTQKGIGLKLKYSNREKNIIKRRRYDKNISAQNNSEKDIEYQDFSLEQL